MSRSSNRRLAFGALIAAGVSACAAFDWAATAEKALVVPPPVLDQERGQSTSETAVLAGGCFWGVQGVYQHVNGVTNALSGYAGGSQASAGYEAVSSGGTGHAESVQITFDPRQVTYGQLLQLFFSVVHDPTTLDRQGPDHGTQYRSAIFPTSDEQARIARAYIAQLSQSRVFAAAVVTKVEPQQAFYPAEGYHQDFLTLNPRHGYIVVNDLPKIDALKRLFPAAYRAEPVLVGRR